MNSTNEGSRPTLAGRIVTETSESIAWVRIDNPQRHNAMSLSMWRELAQHVAALDASPDVRVLALTGTGRRAFVSGADITEFATLRDSNEQVIAYEQAVSDAQNSLATCGKPTVALINGLCMGGGIGLALSCDLRFCTETARFRMPAARLGLGYSIAGLRRAVQVLGYANTADIFFSARNFNGTEAQRLGLVNRCFPDEQFDLLASAAVNEMGSNAPLTLHAAKQTLRHILDEDQISSTDVEQAIRACFESADYREGQLAFREKRLPVFRGQ